MGNSNLYPFMAAMNGLPLKPGEKTKVSNTHFKKKNNYIQYNSMLMMKFCHPSGKVKDMHHMCIYFLKF